MADEDIEKLLEDLKDPAPRVRDRATQALWERWFWQKGAMGLEQLQRSQALLDTGDVEAAQRLLDRLIDDVDDDARKAADVDVDAAQALGEVGPAREFADGLRCAGEVRFGNRHPHRCGRCFCFVFIRWLG